MATTIFNALSVRLSRKIYDPVAAADTEGAEATAALRAEYLNRATRFEQDFILTRIPALIQRGTAKKWQRVLGCSRS